MPVICLTLKSTFLVYCSSTALFLYICLPMNRWGHSLKAGIALLLYLSSPTLPLASPSNYLLKCYQRNILNVSMSSVFSIVQCSTYCIQWRISFYFLKIQTKILLAVKLSIDDFALPNPHPHPHPHTYTKYKTVLFLLTFHCYFNLL